MLLLLACGGRHSLRIAGASPDGSVPPEADAWAPVEAAAGPSDASPEGGAVDATPTARCGSQVSFQVGPGPGVDPGTLCPLSACDGLSATLTSGPVQFAAGTWLSPAVPVIWANSTLNGCGLLCATCQMVSCHSCIALRTFPIPGYQRVWDGSYFLEGTCNGNACMGPTACAPAGHYVANFCMQKGVPSKGSYGDTGCLSLSGLNATWAQPLACASVEFDLPSTVSLYVGLGGVAQARTPIDPGLASALRDLVGSYRVSASSVGFGSPSGASKLQFADAVMTLAQGGDADVVMAMNPLPGDFPGSCSIPMNAIVDAGGQWSLQNPATTCSSGGATVTLYPGYVTVTGSSSTLALAVAGSSTGGTRSAAETFGFAYSGVALRAP
jgi:hypothetical protein